MGCASNAAGPLGLPPTFRVVTGSTGKPLSALLTYWRIASAGARRETDPEIVAVQPHRSWLLEIPLCEGSEGGHSSAFRIRIHCESGNSKNLRTSTVIPENPWRNRPARNMAVTGEGPAQRAGGRRRGALVFRAV
jgi:hypothetical protein